MNTAADVKKRTSKNDFIEGAATIIFVHLIIIQSYTILKKKNTFLFFSNNYSSIFADTTNKNLIC